MNLRQSFLKLCLFFKPNFFFNLQAILAVPIALILIFCIILEGFFFFIVRLTGRLVEKWSYSRKVRKVLYDMKEAKDFKTYQVCSKQLDVMTNRETWKYTDDPPTCGGHVNYDASLLKKKNRNLEQLIEENDFVGMAAAIKSICDSNMYNTFNTAFYSMTFNGTKQTIQEFHFLVKKCIDVLSEKIKHDSACLISQFPSHTIDYLQRCSKEYGNTCLILSGGAMLGLHHFGLIEVLLNEKCLPKVCFFFNL
jgi:TAG lipase / steryl ester hydrolase / phospholipase A2 / LPA acyltransferase